MIATAPVLTECWQPSRHVVESAEYLRFADFIPFEDGEPKAPIRLATLRRNSVTVE